MTKRIDYNNFKLSSAPYKVDTNNDDLQKLIKEIKERNKIIIDLQNKIKTSKKIRKPTFKHVPLNTFNRNYKFIDQKFEKDESGRSNFDAARY